MNKSEYDILVYNLKELMIIKKCNKCNSDYKTTYQGKNPVCSPCRKYFLENYKITNIDKELAAGGSEYATEYTKAIGKYAEENFFNKCVKYKNIRIRCATKYEEIFYHYDYVIEVINNNIPSYFRVEVKAMKSKKRGQKQDPSIIFLEYKNISGGDGWIYGEADYIAFEQQLYFLLIPREKLQEFADIKKINMKKSEKSGEINTLYSRKNRSDLVGCFSLNDIINQIDHFKIY